MDWLNSESPFGGEVLYHTCGFFILRIFIVSHGYSGYSFAAIFCELCAHRVK